MNSYIKIGILILFAIGAWGFYTTSDFSKNNEALLGERVEVRGVVSHIDRDQIAFDGPTLVLLEGEEGREHIIAVPSMGINLCTAIESLGDVSELAVGDTVFVSGEMDGLGNIVPCASSSDYLEIMTKAEDKVYGYKFEYRKGPHGYITLEDTESLHKDFVTGIILFNKKDYEEFKESTEAREGPPAMHMRVYKNPLKLQASAWVEQNKNETNRNLALGELKEVVIAGANAVHYTTDGLYRAENYAIVNGDHVYLLMGSYLDRDSALYRDFELLVDSITLN